MGGGGPRDFEVLVFPRLALMLSEVFLLMYWVSVKQKCYSSGFLKKSIFYAF